MKIRVKKPQNSDISDSISQSIRSMNNKQRGFTLIEILVVLSILSIITVGGFVSFVAYSRSQQVLQSAYNIKLLINQARFNAVNTVKTISGVTCDNSNPLISYNVSIDFSSKTTTLTVICQTSPGSNIVKTVKLPSGLSLISVSGSTICGGNLNPISFASLTGIPNGVPCKIAVSGYNITKTVEVDSAGNVNVK